MGIRASLSFRYIAPTTRTAPKFDHDSQNCQNTFCRDRMARDCTIRHPVSANCGTAETDEIFRAVGGVLQGRCHQRRARRAGDWPHFWDSSLIAIFECHVCAKVGERALTGPCSVGKEAARGVPESRPGLPRRSRPSPLYQKQLDKAELAETPSKCMNLMNLMGWRKA